MNVASTEWRRLSAEELRLLHTIGDLVSIAIERARLYARSAAAGAAEERNRLAREIHDTLAQGLAGIALRLDAADAMLEGNDSRGKVRPLLREALDITRTTLEEARRSVLDLRPAPLEGRTLAEALAELAAGSTQSDGPVVVFETIGVPDSLPGRVETGLYRIAQEAVGNALRHAGATTITVQLAADSGRLVLRVQDDGRGLAGELTDGHFGLTGMNERARLLGGALSVESETGHGTRVEVSVPLVGAP
jgi:two-component system NarL family sensor kinase